MADIKVQRGTLTFGASEDSEAFTLTTDLSLDAVSSTSSAFAKITNVKFASGWKSAGESTDKYGDDLGAYIQLTGTNQVTVYRHANGENVDVTVEFEIWEYTGSASGANEFIVRGSSLVSLGTSDTSNTATISFTTQADCVPFHCGFVTNEQSNRHERMTGRVDMTASGVQVTRVGTGEKTLDVMVTLVEFTGSNWTVQEVDHTFSSGGTAESETISTVTDITEAFCVSSYQTGSEGVNNDDASYLVYLSGATTLKHWIPSGAVTGGQTTTYVVHNSDLSVQRNDSIDGSGTTHPDGSDPQTVNITLGTTLSDLGASAVIATVAEGDVGTNIPSDFWNYLLTSTSNLRFFQSRSTATSEWAYEVIDFSGLTSGTSVTVTPSTLTSTSSVQTPTVTTTVSTTQTPSTLVATSSVQTPTVTTTSDVTLAPSTLTATSSVQAPTVSTTTDTTQTPSTLTATSSVQAPTVTTTENVTITPSTLTASSSVQAPTVSTDSNVTVTPSTLTVVSSVEAPTVILSENATITPSTLTSTSSVQAPTVSTTTGITVTPSVLEITASSQAPVVSTEVNITVSPDTQTVTSSINQPSVTTPDVIVSPTVLTLTTETLQPTLNVLEKIFGPGGGQFINGGVEGSNLVPLKPPKKKTPKEVREVLEVEDISEEVIENIQDILTITPNFLAALTDKNIIEIAKEDAASDLLELMKVLEGLIQNRQNKLLRVQQEQGERKLRDLALKYQMELDQEIGALKERITQVEDENLLLILLHQIH